MKRSTAVAAALWLLATPAAASAATLRTGPDGQHVYAAGPRETNNLDVRETFDGDYPWSRTLAFSDVVAPNLLVGNDVCLAGPPLVCEMRSTDAYLGNRADRARVVVYASGTSRVWGEDGDDTVYAGGGEAYAYGGAGDDTVGAGAQGSAVSNGGPGDDVVTAFQGAFTILLGEAGADTLESSGMNTSAFGGDGPDRITVSGRGRADGGRNDDRISAGGSDWQIDGGAGNDTITVTSDGVDTVTCGPGMDTVTAGLDDVIARDCEIVSRAAAV